MGQFLRLVIAESFYQIRKLSCQMFTKPCFTKNAINVVRGNMLLITAIKEVG